MTKKTPSFLDLCVMQHDMTRSVPIVFNKAYTMPRREIIKTILDTAKTPKEAEVLEDVINYLLLAHTGQHRKGSTFKNPNNQYENLKYLVHIYMVWVQGYLKGDPLIILLALLFHDTVEDGVKNFHPAFGKNRGIIRQDIIVICDQLGEGSGNAVIKHVDALTNKLGLASSEKESWQLQHFMELSPVDQNNKLKDKLANMWDTKYNPPADWSDEKKASDLAFAFDMLAVATNPPAYIAIMLEFLAREA